MSTQSTRNDDASEAAEEEELLTLEQQVEEMAQKILEYRTTLPDQLSSTLSSFLASQRPLLPPSLVDESLLRPESEAGGPVIETAVPSVTGDTEEAEKIRVLKQKISSNASALPVVLNRMKECMARINKLEPSNGIIHPAFKRKKTT